MTPETGGDDASKTFSTASLGPMPIVNIEIVASPNCGVAAGLAQALADVVGSALNSPPGNTWVRLRVLAQDNYAENAASLESKDLPIFVTVLSRALPEGADFVRTIAALTTSIADVTGRNPSRVHIEYAPAAAGRLSFGGNVV